MIQNIEGIEELFLLPSLFPLLTGLTDWQLYLQVGCPEHFLPEEGRGDARPQHGGGPDQRHSRHQSGQLQPRPDLNNNSNILFLQ